jgi:DNA-binding transcriptional LysR family regulator
MFKTERAKEKKGKSKDQSSQTLQSSLNLSEPHLWFPRARNIQRKFILHSGPTNSGKTYQALKALAASERGIYLAPLRLLAAEIAEKLRGEGKCVRPRSSSSSSMYYVL